MIFICSGEFAFLLAFKLNITLNIVLTYKWIKISTVVPAQYSTVCIYTSNLPFLNHGHLYTAVAASTLLGKLFSRCWNLAAGMCIPVREPLEDQWRPAAGVPVHPEGAGSGGGQHTGESHFPQQPGSCLLEIPLYSVC